MSQAIAKTIIEQMGGFGKLRCMVGAHNLLDHGNALSFRFKGSRSFNYCKVTLTADDLYTVELGKIVKFELKNQRRAEGLFFDMLVPHFESNTGLFLSL
ncbi:MAG: hypothetical protein P1V51_19690 [Deltaproteobacteria bacterium]|nr:hypothetical protein [Deltaproteobacteria bacterium]